MKIKIFSMLPMMVTAVLICFPCAVYSYDLPNNLDIYAIYFNYNSSSRNDDAINIKQNYSTTITAPEWNGANNKKFAYVKGETVGIKATLSRDAGCGINSADIHVMCSGNSIGTFPYTNTYTFSGADTLTQLISTTSGNVPSTVGVQELGISWYVFSVNGTPTGPIQIGYTTHDYYTIVDDPKAPFDGSGSNQAGPWTGVLDYACEFANEESIADSVASNIAYGIFFDLGALGENGVSKLYFFQATEEDGLRYINDDDNGSFYLSWFLSELEDSYAERVNCYEVASIFQLFSSAVGCNSGRVQCTTSYDFATTQINPIGFSNFWSPQHWNVHYIGLLNSYVYDSCVRFDSTTPKLPLAWTQNSYLNALISSGTFTIGATPATVRIYN